MFTHDTSKNKRLIFHCGQDCGERDTLSTLNGSIEL